jgi:hypothetical protein
MMSISNYYEDKILDHMLRGTAFTPPSTVYLSLHNADPGETGANEISGGSYARKAISWNAPSGGSMTNSADIDFPNMPAATITHVGIWDAATAGNHLWNGPLTASKTTNSGDTFRIPAGQLTVTLD